MTDPTPDDDRRLPEHRPDDSSPRDWPLAVRASCPGCPYRTVHKRVLVPVTSTSGAYGKLLRATYECAACGHTSALWRSHEDRDEWAEKDKLTGAHRVPETTYTGLVVMADPLILDDGESTRVVEPVGFSVDAELGQRLAAHGHDLEAHDRMVATEIDHVEEPEHPPEPERATCPNGCREMIVTDRGEDGDDDRYRVECPDCGYVAGTVE